MKTRILTFSGRGLGRTQPEILHAIAEKLSDCAALHPDLICFPEEVLICGGDNGNPDWAAHNASALAMFRVQAARLHANIVCGLEEPAELPGKRYNTAYFIDRTGAVIGRYRKRHLTYRAASFGLPGSDLVVVDSDIGRVGLMICFDLGWKADWAALADLGADLVVWPSAYDGGFGLNALASVHQYYIVSSTWPSGSQIINRFGTTVARGCEWESFAMADVDLRGRIYHIDRQREKIDRIRAALGDRVTVTVQPGDNLFEVASSAPDWPPDRIESEFGLMTCADYYREATELNDRLRAGTEDAR